jgi:hypothetical protein
MYSKMLSHIFRVLACTSVGVLYCITYIRTQNRTILLYMRRKSHCCIAVRIQKLKDAKHTEIALSYCKCVVRVTVELA